MISIPTDPNTRLRRNEAAKALTAAGFPVKASTLATKASRRNGPPFVLFGRRPLYRWGDAWLGRKPMRAAYKATAGSGAAEPRLRRSPMRPNGFVPLETKRFGAACQAATEHRFW